jgi:CO/xanthine dehydrogenase FAD-binding subunit
MIRPFAYVRPRTMEEALEALSVEGARPLAGGTDLLVEMRNGQRRPELLVDIKGLEELKALTFALGRSASIGAGVTLNGLIERAGLRRGFSCLWQAALSIATYQLRNRATLAGNLCNASPAADMAPPLYVLDAAVLIAGPQGERALPVTSFLTGVKQNALRQGELVRGVEIPAAPPGAKTAFLKRMRVRGHDLALVNVAGLASRSAGVLRICVGACGPTPLLVPGTEELFRRGEDVERLADAAAALAAGAIAPIDDVRARAEYRRDMVQVLVKRLVRAICS